MKHPKKGETYAERNPEAIDYAVRRIMKELEEGSSVV